MTIINRKPGSHPHTATVQVLGCLFFGVPGHGARALPALHPVVYIVSEFGLGAATQPDYEILMLHMLQAPQAFDATDNKSSAAFSSLHKFSSGEEEKEPTRKHELQALITTQKKPGRRRHNLNPR